MTGFEPALDSVALRFLNLTTADTCAVARILLSDQHARNRGEPGSIPLPEVSGARVRLQAELADAIRADLPPVPRLRSRVDLPGAPQPAPVALARLLVRKTSGCAPTQTLFSVSSEVLALLQAKAEEINIWKAFGRSTSAACAAVSGGALEHMRPTARAMQCGMGRPSVSLYRRLTKVHNKEPWVSLHINLKKRRFCLWHFQTC